MQNKPGPLQPLINDVFTSLLALAAFFEQEGDDRQYEVKTAIHILSKIPDHRPNPKTPPTP